MASQGVMIGDHLPPVMLDGRAGELRIEDGDVRYLPWSSESLKGHAHMLYIVAARMGIDKVNQGLLDALEEAGGVDAFPADRIKVISMINIDDVFPMGGAFARQAFEQARLEPENAHAVFVLDDRSKVQKAWKLKRKSAAVIIVDQQGRVLRFKDGKLTDDEIKEFLSVLEKLRDGETVK